MQRLGLSNSKNFNPQSEGFFFRALRGNHYRHQLFKSTVLRVFGLLVIGVFWFLFFRFRYTSGAWQALLVLGPMVAALYVPLVFLKRRVFSLADRISIPNYESIIRHDPRPRILYLRSFIDRYTSGDFLVEYATDEERIKQLFEPIGPVLAVGEPGEFFPPRHAARLYLDPDSDWQAEVIRLMRLASFVVISPERTPGIIWEAITAFDECGPEKVVVSLFDFDDSPLADRPRKSSGDYEEFREKVIEGTCGRGLTVRLPETIAGLRGLMFDRHGNWSEWNSLPLENSPAPLRLKIKAGVRTTLRRFNSLLDGILVLSGFFLLVYPVLVVDKESSNIPPPNPDLPPSFSRVYTVDDMLFVFQNRAGRGEHPFIGERIYVKGQPDSFTPLSYPPFRLSNKKGDGSVNCYLRNTTELGKWKMARSVMVRGLCVGKIDNEVTLRDCEVISVGGSQR
jgi:hypothetical protein